MAEALDDFISEEDTQHGKYLTFKLGEETFGIEISFVREIISLIPATPIPDSPVYVKGIISLRGSIIAVINLCARLHKQEAVYTSRTCIIILNICDNQVGFVVDEVSEVTSIKDDDVVPPPNFKFSGTNRFLKGIGKVGEHIKLILDCEKLLTEQEFDEISHSIS